MPRFDVDGSWAQKLYYMTGWFCVVTHRPAGVRYSRTDVCFCDNLTLLLAQLTYFWIAYDALGRKGTCCGTN